MDMDIDLSDLEDDEQFDPNDPSKFTEDFLTMFCRKVATSFFNEHGLISHQISSYNEFVEHGVQKVFDSIGEIDVEAGYDPSKKGEAEWKYASVKFGKVTLDRPTFWVGEKFQVEEYLKMLPRHARLQNMTYSSRVNVNVTIKVYTKQLMRSDKFKIGKEKYIHNEVLHSESRDILIGRLPVMVKSNLCWMSEAEKGDCEFDHGGYSLIKGAEKTFIAQEQITNNRLWISNKPGWTIAYRSEWRRRRVYLKLVDLPKDRDFIGEMAITVFLFRGGPTLDTVFFALGMSCDRGSGYDRLQD